MIRSRFAAAGIAGAIALAAAGAGFAQAPVPAGAPSAAMGGMKMKRPDPEAQAQRLRDVLQLTQAQEPALKAFLEAMKPAERPKSADARAAGLATPERLDRQRARMVERLAAFDRRAAATRSFYAQLTPSQKKAFDALPLAGRDKREMRIERRMMEARPGGGPEAPR